MKKILLITGIGIASTLQLTYAQKGINNELPKRLFTQGKEMFLENNFIGAQNTLVEFIKLSDDKSANIEADYMIAASSYFRGNDNATTILREYLDTYPESYHRNDIYFYIGSSYFSNKDWNKAIYWFNQSDIDYLSKKDQEDFTFRSAFANLQEGKRSIAANQFELLSKNSNKYFEPAIYYLAYINFQDGKYDKALATFEQLKNNPEYKEQSLFFITQGLFLKNNLNEAINAGSDYLNTYPNNQNATEIYRILGNSYYRQGDINKSITNYERYLLSESKPFAEDMLQLGTAYTQIGDYQKAIKALQFAASKDNKLGQTAYMLLGQNYLKINDNVNALMAFDAASRVQFDPSVSEVALYNYAMLVHKTSLSVFDQSITVLQRFLTEYPNSKYGNEINNQLASTLLNTKNYQAALTVIDKIKNPGRQILEAKQTILFQLGAQDFIDGNYNEAIQRFNASINMGNYDVKSKNESYFWRAEANYRNNNYATAVKDYQSYLSVSNASDNNYTNALYNLGYAYFNLKQYANALDYFREYAVKERSRQLLTYSDAWNRIGDIYLFNRNYSEAERAYSQASINNPQSAEYADFQKAFVLGLQHNYLGKISALDVMMNKYPNSQYYDDAMYEKSRALIMLNRETDAIPILGRILSDHPNSNIAPQAGVLLGQSYYNSNNSQKAIEAYKEVVKLHKNSEEARIALQSLEGIYRDINDINSFANFANSQGNGIVITANRQDSLSYLAAENIYMKGRANEAANAMNKYLEAYPRGQFSGDAHYYIGAVAYDKKDYETALQAFNNSINSGNSKSLNKALSLIAEIQLNKGNNQAAYNAYSEMLKTAINSEDKNTAQLGVLKVSNILNKDNEVISVATTLLSESKTSPEIITQAYLFRAKAYQNKGENNKANEDLQKASIDTRNIYGAEAHYLLAKTYLKNGNYDKAEQQVLGLMKQGTPHAYWMAQSIIVLSDTYLAKGDKFQAKQYLESLQANYTGNEADITSMINTRLTQLNK